ncbi:hypothetical protein SDC9_196905 [bioreactor metagenome]|uniref:Uncharacterized protein n=1 Tax=bioreactor metagenome TaxID=1076179 RepID=A0A645IDA1_9ZZZZ
MAGIAGFLGTAFQESLFLVLPVLHSGRVGWLGRRRGRPGRQRVKALHGGCGASRHRLRDGRRPALLARAEKHRRSRRRFGLLAQGIVGVVARRHVRGLLRRHDGRSQVARQRRPQLGHLRQLGVIGRQPVQPFGLRDTIHVVQLVLPARAAPVRLQGPNGGSKHGD